MSNLTNCSSQFQADYKQLEKDAAQYQTDAAYAGPSTQEGSAMNEVSNRMEEINSEMAQYKGRPDVLLVVLMMTVFGTALDNAYQYKLATAGDKVQIQNDLSRLTNDIQAAPNAAVSGGDGVMNVAAETDVMQDLLNPADATSSTGGALQSAIGTQAASFMATNFKNVRDDIYWAGDPEASQYNPTEVTTPLPTTDDPSSYTYHFVVDGTAAQNKVYMTDYFQLQGNLAKQGGPFGAQAASSILVNNYNQNVSTTQSLGSAVNSEIGMITSQIKALTNFLSDCFQDTLTGSRTAVKDQMVQ